MTVSTRTRFEVFKRDGFRCVYCGATALAGPLTIDHVEPVAGGGSDDPSNLVTACSICNGGKSDVPLEQVRLAPERSAEEIREHAAQTLGYLEACRELARARDEAEALFVDEWERRVGYLPGSMTSRFTALAERHGAEVLFEAMDIVGAKGMSGNQAAKYFHGILRRKQEEASGPRWEGGLGWHIIDRLDEICSAMASWHSKPSVPTECARRWCVVLGSLVAHELGRQQSGSPPPPRRPVRRRLPQGWRPGDSTSEPIACEGLSE